MTRHGHVNLNVTDLKRAAGFYKEFFGFQPAGEHGDMLVLVDDFGFDLVLEVGDVNADGFHFGFRLSSAEEVADRRNAVIAAGLEPVDENEGGMPGFKVRDPDGHLVETYAYS